MAGARAGDGSAEQVETPASGMHAGGLGSGGAKHGGRSTWRKHARLGRRVIAGDRDLTNGRCGSTNGRFPPSTVGVDGSRGVQRAPRDPCTRAIPRSGAPRVRGRTGGGASCRATRHRRTPATAGAIPPASRRRLRRDSPRWAIRWRESRTRGRSPPPGRGARGTHWRAPAEGRSDGGGADASARTPDVTAPR
jgi:hypothetical protein